jgi:transmembrane sensor
MPPQQGALEASLVRQAFGWMVRLQSGGGDARTRRAFEQWRNAHPDHEQAWLRAQQVGQAMRENFMALPSAAAGASIDALQAGAQRLSRRRALAKLSIAAATAAPAAWLASRMAPWERLAADFSTGRGERRSFTLVDGTVLALNTDSAVQLRFSASQRLLVLTRGEISLVSGQDIASLPQKRPLRVQTRDGLFEPIGMRFIVRLMPVSAGTASTPPDGPMARWSRATCASRISSPKSAATAAATSGAMRARPICGCRASTASTTPSSC